MMWRMLRPLWCSLLISSHYGDHDFCLPDVVVLVSVAPPAVVVSVVSVMAAVSLVVHWAVIASGVAIMVGVAVIGGSHSTGVGAVTLLILLPMLI
jgi:hypothetical protein